MKIIYDKTWVIISHPCSLVRVASCPDNLAEPEPLLGGEERQVRVLPGRSHHCPIYLLISPQSLFTSALCMELIQPFSEMTLQCSEKLAME